MTPPLSEMSGPSPESPRAGLSRAGIEEQVVAALISAGHASSSCPLFLIEAPRGHGKEGLMDRVEARLRAARRPVVRCSMSGAGTAADLARALPRLFEEALGEHIAPLTHPRAAAVAEVIDASLGVRPIEPAHLLDLTFSFPQALAQDAGRTLFLLVDEIGEVMRITHAETKEAIGVIASRLAGSDRIALVGTLSAASRAGIFAGRLATEARSAGRALRVLALPPVRDADLPRSLDPVVRAELLGATAGRPMHVERLLPKLLAGASLDQAILDEMTPPTGLLWHECRFDYNDLVHRCRGDAAVRSVLALLAETEGRTLTEIARHLHIAPPTALDYLRWMHEVDLIRRRDKVYRLSDPLMRIWILRRGLPADATASALPRIVRRVIEEAAAPAGAVAETGEGAAPARAAVAALTGALIPAVLTIEAPLAASAAVAADAEPAPQASSPAGPDGASSDTIERLMEID